MTERLTCDICDDPVEPGQPRMGMKGDGGASGSRYGRDRHWSCHGTKYGTPRSEAPTEPAEPVAPRQPRRAMLTPAVRSGPYNRSANAQRECAVLERRTEMGRTRVLIECPFCVARFWAFVWSLSGGGKKCPNCGAIHGGTGMASPIEGNEDLK